MSPRAGAEHVHHPIKVNDRFVLFLRVVCLGHAALNKCCAMFGIKPMNKAVYQEKTQNRIINVMVESAHTILCETVARVVEAYTEIDADFNGNITISFDRSWHKRGHTSNYGFGAVIDVLTDFNGNITDSFDGSWHKCGHTSSYGFGAVIDVLTGLVVD